MASEAVLKRLHRIGQGSITAEQGLLALGAALRGVGATRALVPLPQLAVNGFVWDTYLAGSSPPSVFADFAPLAQELGAASAPQAGHPAARGAPRQAAGAVASDPAAVKEQVKREVAAAVQQVVGGAVGDDEPLMAAGLDSLGSVEFVNVLAHKLGLQVRGSLASGCA